MVQWIFAGASGVALVGAVVWIISVLHRRRTIARLLGFRLLVIEFPQRAATGDADEGPREIAKTSALFSALANLKQPFVFEAAVANVGEDIAFYVAVPDGAVSFVTNHIHGIWPDAQVRLADEYTIFHAGGAFAAGYLKLAANQILPIKTYDEANIDTFAPILANFSKLETMGEGLALQLIARPTKSRLYDSVTRATRELKRGKKLTDVLSGGGGHEKDSRSFIDVLAGKAKKPEGTTPQEPIVIDEAAVNVLSRKTAKPFFDVNIRFVASGRSLSDAESVFGRVANSFAHFTAPFRNEFKVVKPRSARRFVYRYVMREFENGEAMTLNADEMASVFHFPAATTGVAKVRWLHAREAAPPTTLPASGVTIGESVFRGEVRRVRLSDEDRRRHLYVIGQTGTGKSTLFTSMIADDIARGKGIAVIDPHGDLIASILGLVPRERVGDVIMFDPGDRERPFGLNMLEYDLTKPEEKTFITNELFGILDKLYDMKTVGGPMFEQYTKNAILLLMEDAAHDTPTLIEIPRVFTDSEFRSAKLSRITNPVVVDFWEKEAAKATGEHSLANMAPYITSKFNSFIANDYVRPIIGQPTSSFSFREAMDKGKILLVNLSKGRIGDVNANLLGMIITGKLLMAALSRVDMPEKSRLDFNLYIDEFQNFTTDSIATILSEARKYRLNLTIAHQFIGQLSDNIRSSVFGNVGSLIAFRVGLYDAEFLEQQFAPVFTKADLANIDNFNAYAKLLINGQTTLPFSIRTVRPTESDSARANKIRELSRAAYGRDRRIVESEILERLRR